MNKLFASILLGVLAWLASSAAKAETDDLQAAYRRLARTLNIDARQVEPRPAHLDAIRDAGFTAVRLAENWTEHCEKQSPWRIDPHFLRRMDEIVAQATGRRLAVIIDYHKDTLLAADPAAGRARFLSLWRQISLHYRGAPPTVMFEPMAEPHDKLDAVWNSYFSQALAVIRESNPGRVVLVGPSFYNSVTRLDALALPPDDNLIVCVHTYRPIRFTFQGEDFLPQAPGWLGTHWTGSTPERDEIRRDFDRMVRWSQASRRPLFVEEFGSSSNADLESRVRWTAFNRHEAESRGLSWGFWCFTPPFGIFDEKAGTWEKALLDALIPHADAK